MAQEALGGRKAYGSLVITSTDDETQFGHYWNPPNELHSWLLLEDGAIIASTLPGVIENGLATCDDLGPFLINREPCILAGAPLPRMQYVIIGTIVKS